MDQLPRIRLSLQDLLFLLLEACVPQSQLRLYYSTYLQQGEDMICRVGRRRLLLRMKNFLEQLKTGLRQDLNKSVLHWCSATHSSQEVSTILEQRDSIGWQKE